MKANRADRGICLKVRSSSRSLFRLPWGLWLPAISSSTARISGTRSCWMSWSERRMWGNSAWRSWPSSSVVGCFFSQLKKMPNKKQTKLTQIWVWSLKSQNSGVFRHLIVFDVLTLKISHQFNGKRRDLLTYQGITPTLTWPTDNNA